MSRCVCLLLLQLYSGMGPAVRGQAALAHFWSGCGCARPVMRRKVLDSLQCMLTATPRGSGGPRNTPAHHTCMLGNESHGGTTMQFYHCLLGCCITSTRAVPRTCGPCALRRRARSATASRATSWRWRCRWTSPRLQRRASSTPTGRRGPVCPDAPFPFRPFPASPPRLSLSAPSILAACSPAGLAPCCLCWRSSVTCCRRADARGKQCGRGGVGGGDCDAAQQPQEHTRLGRPDEVRLCSPVLNCRRCLGTVSYCCPLAGRLPDTTSVGF